MPDVHVVWTPGFEDAIARDPRVAMAMERLSARMTVTMKAFTPVSPVLPVYADPVPLGRTTGPVYGGAGETHKGVRYKSGRPRPRRRLPGDLPRPVSGHLRSTIRREWVNARLIRIGTDCDYAAYVNDGTRPHIIRSTGPWPLRNRYTGQVFGRQVRHPGHQPGAHFLEKTAESIDGQRVIL